MTPNEAPSCNESVWLEVPQSGTGSQIASAPGKVFLLGEYAVLAGLPGLIATVAPRFELHPEAGAPFHPESPAGRLLEWASAREPRARELASRFQDPYRGEGGFGASSAQFGLLYLGLARRFPALALKPEWQGAWTLFRELTRTGGVPPSGADIVAQWLGGTVVFDPSARSARKVSSSIDPACWLVFSAAGQAGRKVATHDHLGKLAETGLLDREGFLMKALAGMTVEGIAAYEQGDAPRFARAANAFADELQRNGLEVPATHEDREVLKRLPGVLAVKGTGALQADALWVLLSPGFSGLNEAKDQVLEAARSRGLRLISDGLKEEPGVLG